MDVCGVGNHCRLVQGGLMLRPLLAFAAAGVLVLTTAACADDNEPGGESSLDVVAAFYPLQFAAERVGGEHASVSNLASPGVEPHDLELTPSQVADIGQADLVVFLHGFQPAVDEAVEANAADASLDAAATVSLLEATEPHEHEGEEEAEEEGHEEEEESPFDLHFWLDADRLAGFAGELANAMSARDPSHAAEYTANAEALGEELAALDTEYAEALAGCERHEIVVSHAAFGYLADRYDLEQIAITGLSPEEEPSPQRLAEVIHEAEEHGATTIFFETLVTPEVSQVIAEEVGAQTAVLDPIEGLTPDSDADYLSLMRNNLDTLRAALGCP
jgi:zinc transport system substrate-binding protein